MRCRLATIVVLLSALLVSLAATPSQAQVRRWRIFGPRQNPRQNAPQRNTGQPTPAGERPGPAAGEPTLADPSDHPIEPIPSVEPGQPEPAPETPRGGLFQGRVDRPASRTTVPPLASRVVVDRGDAIVVQADGQVLQQVKRPMTPVAPGDLPQLPTPAPGQTASYRVLDVADDFTVTLEVDGRELPVRLLGAEAPLLADDDDPKGVYSELNGMLARNLLLGEHVYLRYDAGLTRTDSGGMAAAYLYRAPDGLLMNLELVRQGLGLVADDYQFQYGRQFLVYQQKAQADGKGIWSGWAIQQ